MNDNTIAIIGFGEAGTILAEDLAAQGLTVFDFDILIHDPSRRDALHSKAQQANVALCESTADAIRNAAYIFSAVTADSSTDVAETVAETIQPQQIFLDINSVSPDTKRHNADIIEQTGATYIDVAVMAPVPPQRLKVPLLAGGKAAQAVCDALNRFGMNAKYVSDDIGTASAIKMCRSVVVKGMEAITVECFFAARQYGAEQAVLESLAATFPGLGWGDKQPDYFISRAAEHGRRRAAEMRESAKTVAEVGIAPCMANAIAETQQWLVDEMANKGISYDPEQPFEWKSFFDSLHIKK